MIESHALGEPYIQNKTKTHHKKLEQVGLKADDLPTMASVFQTFKNLNKQSKLAIKHDNVFQLKMEDLEGNDPLKELITPSRETEQKYPKKAFHEVKKPLVVDMILGNNSDRRDTSFSKTKPVRVTVNMQQKKEKYDESLMMVD